MLVETGFSLLGILGNNILVESGKVVDSSGISMTVDGSGIEKCISKHRSVRTF